MSATAFDMDAWNAALERRGGRSVVKTVARDLDVSTATVSAWKQKKAIPRGEVIARAREKYGWQFVCEIFRAPSEERLKRLEDMLGQLHKELSDGA